MAPALANALAFQEVAALRARLEDENLALKEEIDATTAAGGIIGASAPLQARPPSLPPERCTLAGCPTWLYLRLERVRRAAGEGR